MVFLGKKSLQNRDLTGPEAKDVLNQEPLAARQTRRGSWEDSDELEELALVSSKDRNALVTSSF